MKPKTDFNTTIEEAIEKIVEEKIEKMVADGTILKVIGGGNISDFDHGGGLRTIEHRCPRCGGSPRSHGAGALPSFSDCTCHPGYRGPHEVGGGGMGGGSSNLKVTGEWSPIDYGDCRYVCYGGGGDSGGDNPRADN